MTDCNSGCQTILILFVCYFYIYSIKFFICQYIVVKLNTCYTYRAVLPLMFHGSFSFSHPPFSFQMKGFLPWKPLHLKHLYSSEDMKLTRKQHLLILLRNSCQFTNCMFGYLIRPQYTRPSPVLTPKTILQWWGGSACVLGVITKKRVLLFFHWLWH